MTTINEGAYLSDAIKLDGVDGRRHTRDVITIGEAADLDILTVIGKVPTGSFTVAAAAPKAGGNTGTGAVTLANPAFGPDVIGGTYTLRCMLAQTDSGLFDLIDPNGDVVETVKVGVASAGTHLKLSIADATDFVVGDAFTIEVTRTSAPKWYALDPDAVDGREVAAGILVTKAAAADADAPNMVAITGGPVIYRADKLVWPDGISAGQKNNAIDQLAALGIKAYVGA